MFGSRRHNGAHFCRQIGAIQHFQCACFLKQQGHEALGHIAHQNGHADGHAALAGRAVCGTYEGIDGLVNVGIRHDDHVVFGATQGLNTFAMASAVFIQTVGNGSRAYKAHGFDIRMDYQGIDGFFVALHHVEYAFGQARLVKKFCHEQAGAGIERAWL